MYHVANRDCMEVVTCGRTEIVFMFLQCQNTLFTNWGVFLFSCVTHVPGPTPGSGILYTTVHIYYLSTYIHSCVTVVSKGQKTNEGGQRQDDS